MAKWQKKTKKIIIGVVIALLICLIGGVSYKIYSDDKAEKEYEQSYNKYIDDLKKSKKLMLAGGSNAETLCNLIIKVWGNAIYEKYDDETDPYTRANGKFVSDFNTALVNLFSDYKTNSTISEIEDNQSSVKTVMKSLQNPPEGLDKCYDYVTDLFDAYKTLTDLAQNPSGNYTGFSENKNDAVSSFMTAFDKLDHQIPEKK